MYTKSFWIVFFCLSTHPLFSQAGHPSFRYSSPDSAVTYASSHYQSNSFLHRWLMGRNYRREWQQLVQLPVFRLSATNLTIKELGGGMQTKSLKLEDSRGQEWALRTVDKDVSGALPSFLHNTIVKKTTQDHISAAMPYGAVVVGSLAKSAGIIAAQPQAFYVADDEALGEYNAIFANTVCMLEERDPKFDDTDNTEEMMAKMQQDNRYQINQKLLLKARLLDILIADWDRHTNNWRWGKKDSAGLRYYYAVPRDRDWAFYYGGGLVPKIIRLAGLRHLINFKENLRYVKSQSSKAHGFDARFLNSLGEEDWKEGIRQMQQALTDSAIERAVKKLPAAVFNQIGPSFIQRLTSRRDGMERAVLKYYRFLSQHILVNGSDNEELFSILPAADGFILRVFRMGTDGKWGEKIYERQFSDKDTRWVTVNGLAGNDSFKIDEGVQSKIRLQLNGGEGNDNFDLDGKLRITISDRQDTNNFIRNNQHTPIRFR